MADWGQLLSPLLFVTPVTPRALPLRPLTHSDLLLYLSLYSLYIKEDEEDREEKSDWGQWGQKNNKVSTR